MIIFMNFYVAKRLLSPVYSQCYHKDDISKLLLRQNSQYEMLSFKSSNTRGHTDEWKNPFYMEWGKNKPFLPY